MGEVHCSPRGAVNAHKVLGTRAQRGLHTSGLFLLPTTEKTNRCSNLRRLWKKKV